MLVECQKCGAPLDVDAASRVVKCRYCGSSTELQRSKTIAMETPAGWKPPQVWTPPAEAPHPSRPLKYRGPGLSSLASLAWALVPIGIVAVSLAASGVISIPGLSKGDRWDGTSTLVCDVNEEIVIEDKQAHVTYGPAVDAVGPNCRVTIRNSRIEGPIAVRGGMNAIITVENSRLQARDRGIEGETNMTVNVRGLSIVSGATNGIVGGVNLHVDIDGPATISAPSGTAISGDTNLELSVRGATIEGGNTAIAGGINPEVRLVQATVRGPTALALRQNAVVDITTSNVDGARQIGRNARVTER